MLLFIKSVMDTMARSHEHAKGDHFHNNCMRWRAERNFWISSLCLVLWLILYKVRDLTKRVDVTKKAD
jgi:hypothetical protein